MTYTKPSGVSYVDMCKWIDANIYRDNLTEQEKQQIYEYIYHLCYMLACKGSYFNNLEDYDEFALDTATKVYLRLINPRQFESYDGDKPLRKVKSVLNYINASIYGTKVGWQNLHYSEIIDFDTPQLDYYGLKQQWLDNIQQNYYTDMDQAVLDVISEIPEITRSIINHTPYRDDKIKCHNYYISCLLNILNDLTLPDSAKPTGDTELTIKLFKKEQQLDNIILWHLDEDERDYLKILITKVKNKFRDELLSTTRSFDLSDDMLESILSSNSTYEYEGGYNED